MQLARPAIALDPRQFGRRRGDEARLITVPAALSDDLKLFATTFMAGFVFVSLLIA